MYLFGYRKLHRSATRSTLPPVPRQSLGWPHWTGTGTASLVRGRTAVSAEVAAPSRQCSRKMGLEARNCASVSSRWSKHCQLKNRDSRSWRLIGRIAPHHCTLTAAHGGEQCSTVLNRADSLVRKHHFRLLRLFLYCSRTTSSL